MNTKTNYEKYELDPFEEYWREQNAEDEDEPYFPIEESKPPHY